MARQRTTVVLAVVVALAAAACGTRLDGDEFVHAGSATGTEEVREDGTVVRGEDGQVVDEATGTAPGTRRGTGARGGGGTAQGGGGEGSGAGEQASGEGGGSEAEAAPGENFASDTGVTANAILVGNITSEGGPLGREPFTPMREGARLYFQKLNAEGGVNGRQVQFISCDDQENPERNKECARRLVNDQKVFAIVGNSSNGYAGAGIVSNAGVPDVGGIPIGSEYYKWPMLFALYGAEGYPRDGTQIGIGGEVYAQSGVYRWLKEELGIERAAVMYYNIPISRAAGHFIKEGLEREGISVVYEPNNGAGRDPANPSWDAEAVNMRAAGAQAFLHAIDIAGFQKLCQSMDKFDYQVKAAVGTVQGMGQLVEAFSRPCRENVYATAFSAVYGDTRHPEIAQIAEALQRFNPGRRHHQWIVDGWAAAKLFTEGVRSMGADVTREGLIRYLEQFDGSQTLDGLMAGATLDWRRQFDRSGATPDCFSVGKWDESAKTFLRQTPDHFHCTTSDWYSWRPPG